MVGLENPVHWLMILLVVLVVFGPKRLPQAGRALGEGIREFRDSMRGLDDADPPAKAAMSAEPDPGGEEPLPSSRTAATANRAIRTGPGTPLPPG